MTDDQKMITMSQGELETIIAVTRVEAVLTALKDKFIDHEKSDKEEFHIIGQSLSRIEKDMHEVPEKMIACKASILKEADQKYVSRKELRAGFVTLGLIQTLFGVIVIMKFGAVS